MLWEPSSTAGQIRRPFTDGLAPQTQVGTSMRLAVRRKLQHHKNALKHTAFWLTPLIAVGIGVAAAIASDSDSEATRPAPAVARPGPVLELFSNPDSWMLLLPPQWYEASNNIVLRDASFAWPRTFGKKYAPGAAVADVNGDGRDDAVRVVWDADTRETKIIALLAGVAEPVVHELHAVAAPPDSIDRPELRTLYWNGDQPRTEFALSLGNGSRPSVRWLPVSCEGWGYQWTWLFGRFWKVPLRCSLSEAAGQHLRRQRFAKAVDIMVAAKPATPEYGRQLNEAEALFEAALHPRVQLRPGTGARATAEALMTNRWLQAMRHFASGEVDSSLAAAGRWRALALRVADKAHERNARAYLVMLYSVVGRSELVEDYGAGPDLDSLRYEIALPMRYHAAVFADELSHRGERDVSGRIRTLLGLDSTALSGLRSWSRRTGPNASPSRASDSPQITALLNFGRALALHPDSGVAAYASLAGTEYHRDPLFQSRALAAIGDRYFFEAIRQPATKARAQISDPNRKAAAYYDSATFLALDVMARISSEVNAAAYADTWMSLESRWITSLLGSGRVEAAAVASERLRNRQLRRGTGQGSTPPPGYLDRAGKDELLLISPRGGSSLVYLPLPTGMAVIARRHSRPFSPTMDYIDDPDHRLYRLIPATRILIQREGGVQVAHGSSRLEPVPSDVARLVDSLARNGGAGTALAQLADIVLPPRVRAAIESEGELLVFGHGPIGSLPFAALLVPGTAGRRMPMADRYAVRFSPTLQVFDFGYRDPPTLSGPRTALVLGDPKVTGPSWWRKLLRRGESDMPTELLRLPAAADEARAVAALLGAEALTGEHASETVVRRHWGKRDVIHIASHAFVYTRRGASPQSHIVLAPDALNDGRIHARDLTATNLHALNEFTVTSGTAELVVLSACESGLGETRWAEGVMGFQRALLAAGARSVIGSSWAVRDDGTKRLMTSFYTHWLRDPDTPNKAEALRRAQNDLRRIPGYEAPYHWAGFHLVGAP